MSNLRVKGTVSCFYIPSSVNAGSKWMLNRTLIYFAGNQATVVRLVKVKMGCDVL
jgi:hypothetical protein